MPTSKPLSNISLESFSEIVEAIYDCALRILTSEDPKMANAQASLIKLSMQRLAPAGGESLLSEGMGPIAIQVNVLPADMERLREMDPDAVWDQALKVTNN